uniref:Uncharacterized protein n=1 Tax=Anopheles coluzzii TaxID=1518534 RepID=A0A8W7PQB1_ANOCL
MAQHARPNIVGHIDPLRPQFSKSSKRATVHSAVFDCFAPNGEYGNGSGGWPPLTTGRVALRRTMTAPAGERYAVNTLALANAARMGSMVVQLGVSWLYY